jgi:hypothetical protein
MIGDLPDTLNDRSIVVSLRRRKPSEKVESFRSDRTEHLEVLARKVVRWTTDHQDTLAASDPDMGEMQNRTADNWRPLFAIATVAGSHWPARVWEIAGAAARAAVEQSTNVQLFADIKGLFDSGTAPVDRMASAEMVESLIRIEGRPWAEWKGGRPMTQNTLARKLGKFGIGSTSIRLHGGQFAKGYYRNAFDDVFACYLPSQTVTTSQPNNDGHCDDFRSVTREKLVTFSKASQPNSDGHCDVVPVSNPLSDE